jgi:hypothetical protein
MSADEDEIVHIEDDLRNLHRRYLVLDRSARQLRLAFYFLIAALVVIGIVGIALGNPGALVMSIFILGTVCAYAYCSRHGRWIDWSLDDGLAVKRTEAQAIEDMVADRLKRLKELKGRTGDADT